MLRSVVPVVLIFLCCALPSSPRLSAQDGVVIAMPQVTADEIVCYVLWAKMGTTYEPFCGASSNASAAYDCALGQIPEGYIYKPNLDEFHQPCDVEGCKNCDITPMSARAFMAGSNVKVRLRCIGGNGEPFCVPGTGKTFCKALEDAKRNACRIAVLEGYGGLRSYGVCSPLPCQPAPACAAPRFRLFRR